jgi:hypothetical protein
LLLWCFSGTFRSRLRKAWKADSYAHTNSGWNQGIMNAAMLGLTDNAAGMAVARAKVLPATGYRFPAFAPHEQDFEPSADHFANMNAGLQLMLLQVRQNASRAWSLRVWSLRVWSLA